MVWLLCDCTLFKNTCKIEKFNAWMMQLLSLVFPQGSLKGYEEDHQLGLDISNYLKESTVRGEGKASHICTTCFKNVRDTFNLRYHVLSHMPTNNPKLLNRIDNAVARSIAKSAESGICFCYPCGKPLRKTSNNDFRVHMMRHLTEVVRHLDPDLF